MTLATFPYIFTVFTPTYNRAHTLPRLFASLKSQTFTCFEWLIVDDGSVDNTKALVEGWSIDSPFPIRYISQENQHKKAAINRGVREASGELFLTIDSDDELLPKALDTFYRVWISIPDSERDTYSGVTGLCVNSQHELVGERFGTNPLDSDSLELYHRYGIRGEKCGFHTTRVMHRFPFREDIEGLAPEALVWFDIARAGYKTRFVNETVRIYHTTSGSITNAVGATGSAIVDSDGRALFAREQLQYDLIKWFWTNPRDFLKEAAYHTRFHMHLRDRQAGKRWPVRGVAARMLINVMSPVGCALYWRDKRAAGAESRSKA